MAEQILKRILEENGIKGIEVQSACIHETEMDIWTAMSKRGEHPKEPTTPAKPKFLTHEMLHDADLIIAMQREHRNILTKFLTYDHWQNLQLLQTYCYGKNEDFYEPEENADCFLKSPNLMESLEKACRKMAKILEKVQQQKCSSQDKS